jgi:hypothetical protein
LVGLFPYISATVAALLPVTIEDYVAADLCAGFELIMP